MAPKDGVPSRLTTFSRRAQRFIAKSRGARQLAGLRAGLGGKRLRKILILNHNPPNRVDHQFAPLRRYRQAIAARLGLIFEFDHVDRLARLSAADLEGHAAVGLKMDWRTPPHVAEATAGKLFALAREAGARAIFFDGEDDLCILWPGVLEASDVCIKKHRFADPGAYARPYVGKSNLTDHSARKYGRSFAEDRFPRTEALTDAQIAKILVGWNLALGDKVFYLSRDIGPEALAKARDIDISCRASVSEDKWFVEMRDEAVRAAEALAGGCRVLAPTDRVSPREFYDELLRARLTISPFGNGEICWRDFEVILCGSAMIKQDMGHVATWPDVYVPHETYVPVDLDFANLGAAVAPYLADPAACGRIARAARAALLEALTPTAFVDRLERILTEAEVL